MAECPKEEDSTKRKPTLAMNETDKTHHPEPKKTPSANKMEGTQEEDHHENKENVDNSAKGKSKKKDEAPKDEKHEEKHEEKLLPAGVAQSETRSHILEKVEEKMASVAHVVSETKTDDKATPSVIDNVLSTSSSSSGLSRSASGSAHARKKLLNSGKEEAKKEEKRLGSTESVLKKTVRDIVKKKENSHEDKKTSANGFPVKKVIELEIKDQPKLRKITEKMDCVEDDDDDNEKNEHAGEGKKEKKKEDKTEEDENKEPPVSPGELPEIRSKREKEEEAHGDEKGAPLKRKSSSLFITTKTVGRTVRSNGQAKDQTERRGNHKKKEDGQYHTLTGIVQGSTITPSSSTTSAGPAKVSDLMTPEDYKHFILLVDPSLHAQKYFHGFVKNEYMMRILDKPGDFIACIVTFINGNTVKEVSGVAVRHEQGGIKFLEIKGKKCRKYHFGGPVRKDSMHDIIEYYRSSGEGLPLNPDKKLVRPIPIPRFILAHERIKLNEELGHGAFGKVYKAVMMTAEENITVAVKTFKMEALRKDPTAKDKFLEEAYVMQQLRHSHIVRLYGICTLHIPIMIAMEYCVNGSVKAYLRKNSGTIPLSTQVRFTAEAASGLRYMERHKWVHRDVAARNCLLNAKMQLKIADFGMTIEAEKLRKHKPQPLTLPIKWLAPEVFASQRFSSKSDAWAFGVTMYEFFTDAKDPYLGFNNKQIRTKLTDGSGFRMTLPPTIPPKAKELIEACWEQIPSKRPTFKQLFKALDVWMTSLK